ncbi:hypothetical protein DFH08DRAFT_799898 [Mycena albidolilacea]|uniref:Uncharacterized protein n=1 Tax=Mycena albidolilacea TaxID=1033008 RepID=A0AAD7AMC0_9AGAR|nr:hypothetical protein DFH08DRAFT_799898 [Mycena albidolilacea]
MISDILSAFSNAIKNGVGDPEPPPRRPDWARFALKTSSIKAALLGVDFDEALGQPFLSNIFDQTPEQSVVPHQCGLGLRRCRICAGCPAFPLFPKTNGRWSILIDSISSDGVRIPFTPSTAGTPAKKIVALIDTVTRTPTASFLQQFIDKLFTAIPADNREVGDDSLRHDKYYEPVSGPQFPIHPLTEVRVDTLTGTAIYSSPFLVVPGGTEIDSLFGDIIMRNMYSVFNFGDALAKAPTENATMQFLSQTDPTLAQADVLNPAGSEPDRCSDLRGRRVDVVRQAGWWNERIAGKDPAVLRDEACSSTIQPSALNHGLELATSFSAKASPRLEKTLEQWA